MASAELQTTVYPFILRGISLLGVDSATADMAQRKRIWHNLAGPWKLPNLDRLSSTIGLDDLDEQINKILAGEQIGRRLIDLDK